MVHRHIKLLYTFRGSGGYILRMFPIIGVSKNSCVVFCTDLNLSRYSCNLFCVLHVGACTALQNVHYSAFIWYTFYCCHVVNVCVDSCAGFMVLSVKTVFANVCFFVH